MKTRIFTLKITLVCISALVFSAVYSQNRREIGNLVLEDVPEIPDEIKSRIQQYQNTRSASFADWLPNDEGILISTRFANTNQLHIVANPGSSRNQITFFNEPVYDGAFCPLANYNGFLFTMYRTGRHYGFPRFFSDNCGVLTILRCNIY